MQERRREGGGCGMVKDGLCSLIKQPEGAIPQLHEKIGKVEGNLYEETNKKVSWVVFWTVLVLFTGGLFVLSVGAFKYTSTVAAELRSEKQTSINELTYQIRQYKDETMAEIKYLREDIKQLSKEVNGKK